MLCHIGAPELVSSCLRQEPCPDRTLLAASSRKSPFFQPGWFHHCFFIVENLHCECRVVVHCVHLLVIWFVCVDSRLRRSPWPLQTLHISHMCWRWTCSHPWTPQNVSSCGCERLGATQCSVTVFFLPLTLWHTHTASSSALLVSPWPAFGLAPHFTAGPWRH